MAFYLHLPCNSSLEYYPNNQPSSFRTQLPKSISLQDSEFEVALTEISYINSLSQFINTDEQLISIYYDFILPEENSIRSSIDDPRTGIYNLWLKENHYGDVIQIINEIQTEFNKSLLNSYDFLSFNKQKNRVFLDLKSNKFLKVVFSEKLKNILGFKNRVYERKNFSDLKVIADYPPDLYFGSSRVYVYTDIINPIIVGNTFAPLLYSFLIKGKEREAVTINPIRSYVDLKPKQIESIFIYLCNQFGEEINFSRGSLSVSLHFRPKKYNQNGN